MLMRKRFECPQCTTVEAFFLPSDIFCSPQVHFARKTLDVLLVTFKQTTELVKEVFDAQKNDKSKIL